MGEPLQARVSDWLDRNCGDQPAIGLAYSGGGDSHALLVLAASWAAKRRVRLHAVTVDHGLRPESGAEADAAGREAQRVGAHAVRLSWTGDKPARGIQAAARQARHTLLSEYCRKTGIAVVLFAHTADDQAETVWMRLQAGGDWRSCAAMGERDSAPVWPEGRGLTVLRPLLDERRSTLRAFLKAQGESWIEDPSNADTAFTRIAVRQTLTALEAAGFDPAALSRLAGDLAGVKAFEARRVAALAKERVRFEPWGGARVDSDKLASVPADLRLRLMSHLATALSGQPGLPESDAVAKLVDGLLLGRPVTAAGVAVSAVRGQGWIWRDRGAVLGRVDHPVTLSRPLEPGARFVWDGRYEIETPLRDIVAGPLGTDYAGLADRTCLQTVPGAARPGLLALRRKGEVLAVAGLLVHEDVKICALIGDRFASRLLPGASKSWFHTKSGETGCDNCGTDSNSVA